MAPRARLELATLRLTAGCSTIELPRSLEHKRSPALQPMSVVLDKKYIRYFSESQGNDGSLTFLSIRAILA